MNRKRYSKERALLLALIACMLLAGGVFAYMFKKTGVTSNQFVPANIVCTVNEKYDVATNTKSSITVTNDKAADEDIEGSNIPAYLRVMLVSYWVDAKGNIIAKKSSMPTIAYDEENWVKSDTEHIYYYKHPVAAGGTTSELLATGQVISLEADVTAGIYQVVEVFAEGIQANPTSTASGVWKVNIDGNGVITSAE